MVDLLARVTRATKRRATAEQSWREEIRAAVAEGASLRAVAQAADITHVRVLHIVKGDPPRDPAYAKAHHKVARLRGKPKECSRCGTTDPDKIYEWANLTGNYDDPADYERMCRTCHRNHDRERRTLQREPH